MFQFGNSRAETNNAPEGSALPNFYGKIRTLEEDYKNLKKGADPSQEDQPEPLIAQKELIPGIKEKPTTGDAEDALSSPGSVLAPASSQNNESERNSFLSDSEPEKKHTDTPGSIATLPTSNSFQVQPPFAEKTSYGESGNSLPERAKPAPAPKGNRKLIIILAVVLTLAIIGGGAYYWFFMRSSSEKTSSSAKPAENVTASDANKPAKSALDIVLNTNNPKQRGLGIDTSSGNTAVALKTDFDKYVAEFSKNSSENDLVELTLMDKNDHKKLISASSFISGFGLNLPAELEKLISGDFSLFLTKENSKINLGVVFQISDKTSASQALTAEESTLPSDFKPLYLEKSVTFFSTTFNSGKYQNADIRYINSSSADNSLDYSIIQDSVKNSAFLIIATSKNQMHSILDYILVK